jgi:dihydroxyacetone kinase-like predicted kinase
MGPVGTRSAPDAVDALPTLTQRYEVQFLLDATDDRIVGLRRGLEAIGDSLVVVGGGGTWKVHVHTNDPEAARALAAGAGVPASFEITDLEGDVARCRSGQARAVQATEDATALVAVADGTGLERILVSLGASVVNGGPGNNPSVGDLMRGIEEAASAAVVLLPNHENILPAARKAAEESAKRVHVVATTSVSQGMAAAAAFLPDLELEDNAAALDEAAEACAWGDVALAVRDAETPAGAVRRGDLLGSVRGEVVAIGTDPADVVGTVVARLAQSGQEILTAFAGEAVDDADCLAVEKRLREDWPDLEIEIHRGDQPGYPYLIGIE